VSRDRARHHLLEAALLACIVAVGLAMFVPTFLNRVRANKINEAAEVLRELSDRAAAYYATSWAGGLRNCLPERAGPTPEAPSVEPVVVDFHALEEPGHQTWVALGFQPDRPIRYSYQYTPDRAGCDLLGTGVWFRAEGDLDGDGVRSIFERRSYLGSDGLKPDGILHIHQRVE